MIDDLDPDSEWAELCLALSDAPDEASRAPIRERMDAATARRIAEADTELEIVTEAYGDDEPTVGTVIADGGTVQSPPGFADANSAYIVLPDGRTFDKEHLLAGRPSDPTDPSGPPAFDGPPAA